MARLSHPPIPKILLIGAPVTFGLPRDFALDPPLARPGYPYMV